MVETEIDPDKYQLFEQEWVDFLKVLKELGIERGTDPSDYKMLIQFIKWQNENSKSEEYIERCECNPHKMFHRRG